MLVLGMFPNPVSEVRISTPCFGPLIDNAPLHCLLDGPIHSDQIVSLENLRTEAWKEYCQCPWNSAGVDFVYMTDDIGGAGVCDGVVPLWAFTQFVCSH